VARLLPMRLGVGAPLPPPPPPPPPRRECPPVGVLLPPPPLLGLCPPGLWLPLRNLELERFLLGLVDLGLVGTDPGAGGSLTHVPVWTSQPRATVS